MRRPCDGHVRQSHIVFNFSPMATQRPQSADRNTRKLQPLRGVHGQQTHRLHRDRHPVPIHLRDVDRDVVLGEHPGERFTDMVLGISTAICGQVVEYRV